MEKARALHKGALAVPQSAQERDAGYPIPHNKKENNLNPSPSLKIAD